MPKVIVRFKDKILAAYPLTADHPLTVGRHGDNDIIVENLAVSSHHARIEPCPAGFRAIDLNSKNGMFINGQAVLQSDLVHGDQIVIGKHVLEIDLQDEVCTEACGDESAAMASRHDAVHSERTMGLETSHGRQLRGEIPLEPELPETDALIWLAGGEGSTELSGRTQVTIGKNKDADIVIGGIWALLLGAPAAEIYKQAGSCFLRHSGGLIKPRRNGVRIKGTVKLHHEDVVDVGPVKLKIQLSARSL